MYAKGLILCYFLISTAASLEFENKTVTTLGIVVGSSLPTPIAIDAHTFTDLIKNGNIFIDKSMMIKELLYPHENSTKFRLITRPKGWGKSVMLDLLRIFFEKEMNPSTEAPVPLEKSRAYRLFELGEVVMENGEVRKLKKLPLISKYSTIIKEHMGQYPVLYANFSGLRAKTANEFRTAVAHRIRDSLLRYHYVNFIETLKSLDLPISSNLKYRLQNVLDLKGEWWTGVRSICELLKLYFGRSPIILLDDYDEPLVELMGADVTNKSIRVSHIAHFYSKFFAELEDADFYTLAIVSGMIRMLLKNDILENELQGEQYGRYLQYHGFSLKEVDMIFKHLGIPKEIEQKAIGFYGGYKFNEREHNITCPASLAKFLASRKFEHYFDPSLGMRKIADLCIENPHMRPCFHRQASEQCDDHFELPFREYGFGLNLRRVARWLNDTQLFPYRSSDLALLVAAGYLTNGPLAPLDYFWRPQDYELRIPNQEVRDAFKYKLYWHHAMALGFPNGSDFTTPKITAFGKAFKEFALDDRLYTPEFNTSFKEFILELPCFKTLDSVPGQLQLHNYTGEFLYNALNFITLQLNCFEFMDSNVPYEIGYEGDEPQCSLTVKHKSRGVILYVTFGRDSVELALNETKQRTYHFMMYEWPDIETVKHIAINYEHNGNVEVVTFIQPMKDFRVVDLRTATEPTSEYPDTIGYERVFKRLDPLYIPSSSTDIYGNLSFYGNHSFFDIDD